VTTPEREEARADLIAWIKAIPCARPEDAVRVEKKWGLTGMTAGQVRDALEAAASRGLNPRDFTEQPPLEGTGE
jgi:hypothetical protein